LVCPKTLFAEIANTNATMVKLMRISNEACTVFVSFSKGLLQWIAIELANLLHNLKSFNGITKAIL